MKTGGDRAALPPCYFTPYKQLSRHGLSVFLDLVLHEAGAISRLNLGPYPQTNLVPARQILDADYKGLFSNQKIICP